MFVIPERQELEARKKLLLVQSEIYRCALSLQCARIEASTVWLDRALSFIRDTYPLLMLVTPFLGFAAVKKRSLLRNFWVKGLFGWQLYRKLWPRIKTVMAKRGAQT
ncbi:MAG: hypothetical protein ABI651_01015 [Verrucomicrobiota bacterium]